MLGVRIADGPDQDALIFSHDQRTSVLEDLEEPSIPLWSVRRITIE